MCNIPTSCHYYTLYLRPFFFIPLRIDRRSEILYSSRSRCSSWAPLPRRPVLLFSCQNLFFNHIILGHGDERLATVQTTCACGAKFWKRVSSSLPPPADTQTHTHSTPIRIDFQRRHFRCSDNNAKEFAKAFRRRSGRL